MPPPPGYQHPDENQDEADRSTFRATDLVSPVRHLKEETDRQSDDFYYCDDGKEVTMTAKFWYVNDFEGGQENAEAIVEKFVATTNEALSNSKVPIKYQKWGSVQQHPLTNGELSGQYQIDGTESNELFVKSMGENLEDMEYLKQTADHMVLLYNTLGSEPNRCWGFYYNDEWWNGNPFRTIIVTGTMDNDETFAHEAGHCMGAMHNREVHKSTHILMCFSVMHI